MGAHLSSILHMAQKPSGDAKGFSPSPGPWESDLSNRSESLEDVIATVNPTETISIHKLSTDNYMIIMYLVAVMFALCGLVGNGTVIWLLGFRLKRNPFSVYILNLAIADTLYLLCFIVTQFPSADYNGSGYELFIPFQLTSYLAGLSLLMAISTERCVSALFPIWYRCHRPAHLSAIVCAVVWGLSLCLGIPWLVCIYPVNFPCDQRFLVFSVTSFLTLLVLCASSLTLLIRVRCCSRQRQATKLCRVILLTVLAFLVLDVSYNLGYLTMHYFPSLFDVHYFVPILEFLSVLNSAVNPVIYFFVGRLSQQPGRKSLREVLQSALTEDT